jgi:hypothetical protein
VLTILISNVIANENRRVDADKVAMATIETNRYERVEQFRVLTASMQEGFSEIRQRLTRIETKIEKK